MGNFLQYKSFRSEGVNRRKATDGGNEDLGSHKKEFGIELELRFTARLAVSFSSYLEKLPLTSHY